ncbi:MAG: hypothetical protein LBR08_13375 [Bacteroidales bacterium]|jgi:hypothetical protein|nr:hypothetical protein [Bacteroidales bacterium]
MNRRRHTVKHYGKQRIHPLFAVRCRLFAIHCSLFMILYLPLFARDSVVFRRDFEYVRQSTAWLNSDNASGLQYLPVSGISRAEVSVSKSNGSFVNYHQSDDSYEFGALAESFFRLTPRTVFYGKIHYGNFTGKHMGGSMLLDPYSNAFNLVEMAEDTQGSKNRESYDLSGALGVRLYKGWSVGGGIDYRVAHYVKYKDVRHINKFFDLSATAGVNYRWESIADVGVNYSYRRSIEGLNFRMYGTTDRQYLSLIDFGSFYGRTELFGEDGYVDKNTENPIVNEWNGFAVQLNLTPFEKWSFFNEFSGKRLEGYYGKKSDYTPVYAEHRAAIVSYAGTLSFDSRNSRHSLKASVESEHLENFENIYREENRTTGRTDIVYYGNNKVLDKNAVNAGMEYTANLDVTDHQPAWTLKAGANLYRRRQTTSVYPYFRRQTLRYRNVYLSADKKTVRRANEYGVSLGLLYGWGGGTAKDDGTYAQTSDSQRPPKSSDANLYREYEYLTAARAGVSAGVGYARMFRANLKGYARLAAEWTHAPDTEYLADGNFCTATLVIGCNF